MTGDAPQPGETPRTESNPWSLADPGSSWWPGAADPPGAGDPIGGTPPTGTTGPHGKRDSDEVGDSRPRHPRRRPPQGSPADGDTGTLLGERPAEPPRTDPGGIERDHDRPDPHRYDPLRPPAGHTARQAANAVAADQQSATQPSERSERPERPERPEPPERSERSEPPEEAAAAEPDVMVLPEPSARNRPTLAFDRGPVPGQSRPGSQQQPPATRHAVAHRHTEPLPLPPPTGHAATDARLEKLENSPFWLAEHERPADLPLPDSAAHLAIGSRRSPRHVTRRPAPALLALITLALVATFFAWVSAEPFWLAVGHGKPGYATTTACTGSGVTQRCTGRFTAVDGGFAAGRVTLLGVGTGQRAAGTVSPARMVSRDSRQAYLGAAGPLVQLRWVLGFVLVLICGYAIAGVTGARRLDSARARRAAVLASLAAPLLLLIGFLAATY